MQGDVADLEVIRQFAYQSVLMGSLLLLVSQYNGTPLQEEAALLHNLLFGSYLKVGEAMLSVQSSSES